LCDIHEAFLVHLEALLSSLFVGGIREASLSYMDDVNLLSEDKEGIIVLNGMCRAFEEVSRASTRLL
jgi:hypothetical protein